MIHPIVAQREEPILRRDGGKSFGDDLWQKKREREKESIDQKYFIFLFIFAIRLFIHWPHLTLITHAIRVVQLHRVWPHQSAFESPPASPWVPLSSPLALYFSPASLSFSPSSRFRPPFSAPLIRPVLFIHICVYVSFSILRILVSFVCTSRFRTPADSPTHLRWFPIKSRSYCIQIGSSFRVLPPTPHRSLSGCSPCRELSLIKRPING